MKAGIIYNPSAGKGRGDIIASAVRQGLIKRGLDADLHATRGPKDATAIARRLAPEVDVLVAVGGDGTVNEVANGMSRADPLSAEGRAVLGIVPAGTVNVLALELVGVLDYAPGQLPLEKPRYLMGVGKPDDIVGAVERGVDMFDCVLPTRSGRNGQGFTWDGPINIRNAKFAEDPEPIDPASPIAGWSKAYLHHLVKSGEMLGAMLMTEHNLWFYQQLMAALRGAIAAGELTTFANGFRSRYLR